MKLTKIVFSICFIVILCFFTGCSKQIHKPLSSNERQQATSADIRIFLKQQEIHAEIKGSGMATAFGGGLLPALIDMAVEKKQAKGQEKYIQPIRDSLIDLDFGTLLARAIEEHIKSASWLHIGKVNVYYEFPKDNFNKVFNDMSADVGLMVKADYAFVPDFKELKIISNVALYRKISTKQTEAEEPIYTKKEDALQYWSSEKASKTRITLEKGVQEIAKMITYDLGSDKEKEMHLEDLAEDHISGKLIDKDDQCRTVRLKNGTINCLCICE
jgi:hypothetical protein